MEEGLQRWAEALSVFFFFLILVAVLSLHGYAWLSLAAMSAGYSLVAVLGLLSAVASLVAELGLQAQGFQ